MTTDDREKWSRTLIASELEIKTEYYRNAISSPSVQRTKNKLITIERARKHNIFVKELGFGDKYLIKLPGLDN